MYPGLPLCLISGLMFFFRSLEMFNCRRYDFEIELTLSSFAAKINKPTVFSRSFGELAYVNFRSV